MITFLTLIYLLLSVYNSDGYHSVCCIPVQGAHDMHVEFFG